LLSVTLVAGSKLEFVDAQSLNSRLQSGVRNAEQRGSPMAETITPEGGGPYHCPVQEYTAPVSGVCEVTFPL
jgi:hypothetical protein